MRLIINGYEIELGDAKISRTLQVNDIISLENRQSNYSATFEIPRTAKNVRSFNRLGVIGSNSNIPYQRNNAYLYSDTDECLVYNGWAIIKKTTTSFSCNIVDGNIDLYKAIENTKLSDLDLSEANHFKTLTNVLSSFNDTEVYKYIIADYNGKALYDTNKINIDYLTPSIPISYLWDKVFDTYGFTYEGQVFNTFDFQNLYLTYPKGTLDDVPTPEIYYTNTYDNLTNAESSLDVVGVEHNNIVTTEGVFLTNDVGYVVPTSGTYIIDSDLTLSVIGSEGGGSLIDYEFIVFVNGVNSGLLRSGILINQGQSPIYLQLNAGDIIELKVSIDGLEQEGTISSVTFNSGSITYSFLSGFNVDFNDTLIDFETKDFLKMVLNYFGLTPFKDKYSNNYKFLTLYELLQNPVIEDWSAYNNKFVSLESEEYIYGDYARKNNFIYKYNDSESDYYNGSVNIDNVNLEDSKNVYEAPIFAPEKIKTNVFERETNVYKLWDKNIDDESSVTYKSLDKRFYLMRSDHYVFSAGTVIGSEVLQTETTIFSAPFESFLGLKFQEIIADYYAPISQILNQTKIHGLNIYLNDLDIQNIDFSSLKWIEETNKYYLLNKVSNYSSKGINKVEMIKVDYVNEFYESDFNITITGYSDGCLTMNFNELAVYQLQYSLNNGLTWQFIEETINGGGNHYTFSPECGFTIPSGALIRLYNVPTDTVISNNFQIA